MERYRWVEEALADSIDFDIEGFFSVFFSVVVGLADAVAGGFIGWVFTEIEFFSDSWNGTIGSTSLCEAIV